MNITMLGSGCWEGVPAPFCNCKICSAAAENPFSQDNRTRPQFIVENNGQSVMLELSPDIRTQSARHKLPPVTDFIISHWHFDHLFGLYELDAWSDLAVHKPLNIYCSSAVEQFINKQFGHIATHVTTLSPYIPFEIAGITVTPVPVRHMRHADTQDDTLKDNNTFGFILESDGQKLAYLADYYELPPETIELIHGADVVIADGTYLFENHYPQKPYQIATLKEQDPDHIHGEAIIELAQSLNAHKVVYHSITHLPELTHEQMQELLPDNHLVGYDGLSLLTT